MKNRREARIEISSPDGYHYFEGREMRCLRCPNYEGCKESKLRLCKHLPEKEDGKNV
jgi:hypothetical protein